MDAQECNVLKGFSISGGWEYPEKLGNALAQMVFKLIRTFLGHPGGAAGPASRPPWAAQGGVRLFFSRAGVENPHVRIFQPRPAGPGRREDIFFTGPAGQGGVRVFSSRPRLKNPHVRILQSREIRFPNAVK